MELIVAVNASAIVAVAIVKSINAMIGAIVNVSVIAAVIARFIRSANRRPLHISLFFYFYIKNYQLNLIVSSSVSHKKYSPCNRLTSPNLL